MSQVAEATGLSRESLYRALSANGNPTLSTTLRVLKALGLRLTVAELEDCRMKQWSVSAKLEECSVAATSRALDIAVILPPIEPTFPICRLVRA